MSSLNINWTKQKKFRNEINVKSIIYYSIQLFTSSIFFYENSNET